MSKAGLGLGAWCIAVALTGMAGMAGSAAAEELTIDRLVDSPSLSGPSVQGLQLSPDGRRITFLRGKESNQAQLDLWEFDSETGATRLLVDSASLLPPGGEELSEEEKARRERNRALTGKSGIVSYFWSRDAKNLLFPLGGDVFVLPLGGEPKQLTDTEAYETDIKFSPGGSFVSFIRERELYVVDVASGQETKLTSGASETVANGMAEFIAQEELGRFTGYWWSPDDSHIVFEQFDESGVEVKDRYEIQPDGSVITRKQRYPSAGTANVTWRLGVVPVTGGQVSWVDIPDIDGGRDDYLARVNWLKDGESFLVEQMNRSQTKLRYLRRGLDGAPSGEGDSYTYENPVWVNLYNDFHRLADGTVLITRDWDQGGDAGAFRHILRLDPVSWKFTPLTSGQWVVTDIAHVDEDAGVVYFAGLKDSPIEQHLYRVPLDGGEVQRVTAREGWHDVTVGDGFFVDRFSSPSQPPQIIVKNLEDASVRAAVLENNLDSDHPYGAYTERHAESFFGTIKAADGVTDLYYRLYLPPEFKKGQRYPAIMAPYGGPHGQRVRKEWTLDFNQYLARQGYVVMVLDNRGMWNRGVKFESAVKNAMGRAEVADQVAGVHWLVENGYADASNVGIWGWSYGGYMTLMSLFQAGDTFKAGVSVAPVTDWRLYDTGYTERYLGLPDAPGDVYNDSSVFKYAGGFKGDLLLIHGMADDNVFFDNSVKLMAILQGRRMPFELMTYPGKKHGIRGASSRAHLWKQAFGFFERKLK